MYTQYFILVLCLLLLGGSNSAKSRDRDNGWEKSNTMSREKGEHHKEVKKQEIWIDDEDEGSGPDDRVDPTTDDEDMWDEDGPSGHGMNDDEEGDMGSGKDMSSKPTDDEDMFEGSAGTSDDEDSSEGSAVGADLLSDCLQLQLDVQQRGLLGAYKPDCTENGEFEKIQCHGSVCWCVDKQGRDITGTRGQIGEIQCEEGVVPIGGKGNKDRIKPIIKQGGGMDGNEPKDKDQDEENRDDNDIGYNIDTPTGETSTEVNNAIPVIPEEKTTKPEENPDFMEKKGDDVGAAAVLIGSPGILAGIIGGAVVGLLCAVLLVMFIVYRMRKKDEGSYPLDEPKKTTPSHSYQKAPTREFYA